MAISAQGIALGHKYDSTRVNAPCPKCSDELSAQYGRPILALDCEYDVIDEDYDPWG